MTKRLPILLAAAAVAACSFGEDYAGTQFRCDETELCPDGQQCVDGRCTATPGLGDGAVPDTSANDDGPAGGEIDAAPTGTHDAGCSGGECPYAASVGSFSKVTGPAPAVQVVTHGLGQRPRALLLWSAPTSYGDAGFELSVGLTDELADSRTAMTGVLHGQSTSNTARGIVDSAIALVEPQSSWPEIVAEAQLQGWDEDSFTLRWIANDARPVRIHYLAVGGPTVRSKLVRWTMPTTAKEITVDGVGFSPTGVLHAHTGHGVRDPAPYETRDAAIGLGLQVDGEPGWAATAASIHGEGTTRTIRGLATGASVFAVHADDFVTKRAEHAAMTPDGFALDFVTANDFRSQIASLAFAGVAVAGDCFEKTAGDAQTVAGVGFTPDAVVLVGTQQPAGATPSADMRFAIGAATPTAAAGIAVSDTGGLSTSVAHTLDDAAHAYIKFDTSEPPAQALGAVTAMTGDGFTVTWLVNDAAPTQVCYMAFGPAP